MGSSDPFEPGQRIGSYQILREIGRGGMGRVYLAKDVSLDGKLVAIKVVLNTGRDSSADAHARFLHEVRSLARLDHRNIVSILTAGNHDGHPYFVMKYIPGRDLSRFTDECSLLPEPERVRRILRIMIQVARAVQYAHDKKLVHRDLKPANILISDEADEPMVLDFGIAKSLGETSLTKDSESPGTPGYRAPEQIDIRLKLRDELVDVWALGVILYRTLGGTHPFKGDDFLSIAVQIVQAAPVPLRILNPHVSAAVEQIVAACLEKNPRHRLASPQEVAQGLERALAADPSTASTTIAMGHAGVPLFGNHVSKGSATPARVGVALLVVALGAAGMWSQRSRPETRPPMIGFSSSSLPSAAEDSISTPGITPEVRSVAAAPSSTVPTATDTPIAATPRAKQARTVVNSRSPTPRLAELTARAEQAQQAADRARAEATRTRSAANAARVRAAESRMMASRAAIKGDQDAAATKARAEDMETEAQRLEREAQTHEADAQTKEREAEAAAAARNELLDGRR